VNSGYHNPRNRPGLNKNQPENLPLSRSRAVLINSGRSRRPATTRYYALYL